MNAETNSTRVMRVRSRFSEAPLELRAFAIFSLLVTVCDYFSAFWNPETLRAAIFPFIGGTFGMAYSFGLFFMFALIFMRVPPADSRPLYVAGLWKPWMWKVATWFRRKKISRPYAGLRFGFIIQLLLQIYFGCSTAMRYDGNDYGNPFLRVNRWQPLFTIVLPGLWILLLFSPRMNRFCNRPAEVSNGLSATA